jgi:hypothetical protein
MVLKNNAIDQEAQLIFGANDVKLVKSGTYVRCAVSREKIPLDDLRYWSVELQEAYKGPEEVAKKFVNAA